MLVIPFLEGCNPVYFWKLLSNRIVLRFFLNSIERRRLFWIGVVDCYCMNLIAHNMNRVDW
jgi:hypothetical protein